ncbi:MAG: hypothetical protein LC778_10235 [Acidobacteria bacterium]|nr:hypothetical protein [Acidobacteriota bacterium]
MNLGELTAHIEVKNESALRQLAETHRAFSSLDRPIGDATGLLQQFTTVSNLPMMFNAAGAAWQLSGALGTIPAAAGAAAIILGALKLATAGFGDALKNVRDPAKFAESIKTMPPAMQDVMRSIQALVPAWDTMRNRVQETFWSGMNTHVDLLGRKYMPVVNTAMFQAANSMGSATRGIAQFLEESTTISDVSQSFGNMQTFIDTLISRFPNLVQAILDVVTVGSASLPSLSAMIGGLIDRFTAFIAKARESGQLGEWIQAGVDSLAVLGQIIANLGGLITGVFQASNSDGGTFLTTIRDLTANMLAWVQSAEGQEKIGEVFSALGQIAFALLEILPHLVSAVFTLASIFTSLPGPIQSIIGGFIGWSAIMGPLIGKFIPLIGALTGLEGSVIRTAAIWVAQWGAMAIAALTSAARMAAAWIIAMGPIGWIIAAIIALVAIIVLNWDTVTNATKAAWDAIVNFVKAAWEWITGAVKAGVDFLVNLFLNFTLVGLIIKHWETIKRVFSDGISAAVNFMKELPGKIIGALGDLGRLLFDAGKRIIQGLIDGIKNMLGAVRNAIGSVASTIRDALPFSPAKWGPLSGSGSPDIAGQRISQMLASGIRNGLDDVIRASVSLTNAASPGDDMVARLTAALPTGETFEKALELAIQRALNSSTLRLESAGAARVINTENVLNKRRLGGI